MDMLVGDTLVLDHPGSRVRCALRRARRQDWPFRHWLLRNVLPEMLARSVTALPFAPHDIDDTRGKRDTHNTSRIFVSPGNRRRFPTCAALAEAFQDEATTALLQDICGVSLDGSFLRIECCLDTDGFWLESHTDIGAKLLSLIVYVSDQPNSESWGTDIMDPAGHALARVSGAFNNGLLFVPASDTWHGFSRRRIDGVRRSVIVNYVKPEWRSRHELAFPETPVASD